MKRAQGSTEYLMILAVVLVVGLAVVAIMGGFPTLTGGVSQKDSDAYWQAADIGLSRTLSNQTSLHAVLQNNKNFDIRVTAVSVDGIANSGWSSLTLLAGQKGTTLLQLGNATGWTNPCTASTTGKPVYITLSFTYQDAQNSAIQYAFTGDKKLVAICQ